ncbi:BAR adaptor protein Hob1 [Malassezia cuniculi]|uniref:BAR adaptor protein Hob1 n=1 Tax=Malassezia cuniculi TaxID=948313 RepID=A0AAF0ERV7_9BASI|nr:BAR adaptor protein Hob1 [Malassezia cuniculi]
MKGFTKLVKRAPHLVSSKVGLAATSTDVEFDHLKSKFQAMQRLITQLLKESTSFLDSARNMISSSATFAHEFSTMYHPLGSEYDLERRYPQMVQTLVNLTGFIAYLDDLRDTLRPEFELIATRIIEPARELEQLMKGIDKAVTKRDHKLIDFDRHNNSYLKLKEKTSRSSKEDQNMYRLESEVETSASDYEYHNNMLKEQLPKFLEMCNRLVSPLFYSLYYMQLNIFYLSMEKLRAYAQDKFDLTSNDLTSLEHVFTDRVSDITERLNELSIRKPLPPSARVLQMARSGQPLSTLRKDTNDKALEAAAPATTVTVTVAPTAAGAATATVATTPAVPPPAYDAPKASYVVALYDYTAQAEGDLSFRVGDRIEVIQRTGSTEDWWTGRLNGVEGVFPGNYVQDA